MAKGIIANLHQNLAILESKSDFVKDIRSKINEMTSKIPDLMGRFDISEHLSLKKTKSKILQSLNKKRGKFRLALESLGWGTMADLLEAAFCGEKLNIWV